MRRVAATIETRPLVWYSQINAMGQEDLITEYGPRSMGQDGSIERNNTGYSIGLMGPLSMSDILPDDSAADRSPLNANIERQSVTLQP